MKDKINDNLYALYDFYNQYKLLFAFWKKYQKVKNEDDIRERIEYLKNPNVKQRSELECLLWLLDEVE